MVMDAVAASSPSGRRPANGGDPLIVLEASTADVDVDAEASSADRQGVRARPSPHSLGEALRAAGVPQDGSYGPGSETPSEEDYDENVRPALADGTDVRRRPAASNKKISVTTGQDRSIFRDQSGVHIYPNGEKALQEFLRRSSQRAKDLDSSKKRGGFGSFVFSKQFSTFDRHNDAAVNSPFHGFYNLFWLSMALFVFKISADNWRTYGNPLGSYEIVRTMFSRDGTSTCRLLLLHDIRC